MKTEIKERIKQENKEERVGMQHNFEQTTYYQAFESFTFHSSIFNVTIHRSQVLVSISTMTDRRSRSLDAVDRSIRLPYSSNVNATEALLEKIKSARIRAIFFS